MFPDPRVSHLANALSTRSPHTLDLERLIPLLDALANNPIFWHHCQMHGLTSLAYHNAKTLGIDRHLPPIFKQTYYRTLSDNLVYRQALEEIATPCKTQSPILVLKGHALIHLIYKNPALRPMSDIDLLVHPTEVNAFKQHLCDLGYTPVPLYPDIFTRDKIAIDLHIDPLNATRIHARSQTLALDPETLRARSHPLPGLHPFHMLDLGDQIITLANHALKHGFNRKIWLIDVLGCLHLAQEPGASQTVLQQCKDARAMPVLIWCLHAIAAHLSHPLPAWAETIQKSFPIGPIRLKMLHIAPDSGPFQILEPLVLLNNVKGIRQKIRFLCEMAFPKRAVLSQIAGYPDKASLSYLHRLIQLITQGALQIARILYHMALSKTPKPQSLFK